MDKELLKQVVMEQGKRAVPRDYVPRTAYNTLKSLQKNPEIIILSGVRRCGKSTILQKLRSESREKNYYLNFEDDRLIHFKLEDFQLLMETFSELFVEERTVYFDEIQNIAGWESFIRRLYEDGYKVFITGSNAAMLSKELGSKLTGRHIPLEIHPYSFAELVQHQAPDLLQSQVWTTEHKSTLKRLFARYCETGGIPTYVAYGGTTYLQTLYENIIYRDIIARYKLPQERPIKELAFYLASNVGKELTFNALRKLIGVKSASTVSEYCTYLENSYLSFLINRYSHSLKQKTHHAKKLYLIDHALASVIGFRISDDKGRLLENIVFLELKRRGLEIFFHKDKKECDFVIREQNRITSAIQVTVKLSDEDTKQRELNGLLDAMQCYNLTEGLIITEDTQAKETLIKDGMEFQINCVPLWKWLLE